MGKIISATSPVDEGMMSLAEAATFSGLSESELRKRMKDGRLRHCRIGKRLLVPRRSLREMLEKGMVTP